MAGCTCLFVCSPPLFHKIHPTLLPKGIWDHDTICVYWGGDSACSITATPTMISGIKMVVFPFLQQRSLHPCVRIHMCMYTHKIISIYIPTCICTCIYSLTCVKYDNIYMCMNIDYNDRSTQLYICTHLCVHYVFVNLVGGGWWLSLYYNIYQNFHS